MSLKKCHTSRNGNCIGYRQQSWDHLTISLVLHRSFPPDTMQPAEFRNRNDRLQNIFGNYLSLVNFCVRKKGLIMQIKSKAEKLVKKILPKPTDCS